MIMSISFLKYNAIKKNLLWDNQNDPSNATEGCANSNAETRTEGKHNSSHNSTSEGNDVVSKSCCSCHLPYNTALKGPLPTSSIWAIGRKGISSNRYCYHWDAEQRELERGYTFTFNQSINQGTRCNIRMGCSRGATSFSTEAQRFDLLVRLRTEGGSSLCFVVLYERKCLPYVLILVSVCRSSRNFLYLQKDVARKANS